jgi:hypothetical protein
MDKIFASNKSNLMNTLTSIDVTVPLPSEGRNKEHRKRWSICYWLSTYPHLLFPIILAHRDKPDFYIKSSDYEIGIEHTDATTQEYALANAIFDKNNGATVLDMSLFRWGQRMKPHEVYEIASHTELKGPGWEGDSPEIDWAVAMAETIKGKTAKLCKKNYEKFSANYLLIYDRLPRPYINFSKSRSYLVDRLNSYWKTGFVFDIIFVQTDDLLISFSSSKSETFKNFNLW